MNDKRDLSTTNLGDSQTLDLSQLTDEQKNAVQVRINEAKIDLATKEATAKLDIQATKETIDGHVQTSNTATQQGTSYTATISQDTSIGRTEVVVGNTERAAKGKMSRSGAGQSDISLKAILIVGAVILFTAMIFGS